MTRTQEALETAVSLLAAWTQASEQPEPERVDLVIKTADLITVMQQLQQADWGYLAAITGLDLGPEVGEMAVLYHFCHGAAVLTLRVPVERKAAVVPSICRLIPSASFFERELSEMFGITVAGTPNPAPLFLPDEWPAGVYPLRKDYRPKAASN